MTGRITALAAALSATFTAAELCGESSEDWILALERLGHYTPSDYSTGDDDIDEMPSPEEVRAKYSLTKEEVLSGLKAVAQKYGIGETDEENINARCYAIGCMGAYGTTNDLPFLATILNNPDDYAQQEAIGATLRLLIGTKDLIPFVHSVATNNATFSRNLRGWTECGLFARCDKGGSDDYIDDPALHAKIAAYFLERAKEEAESSLFIDKCACKLNPWYRHSQLRRDNLARARSREQNLSETAAAAYDARQRDAAAEGD